MQQQRVIAEVIRNHLDHNLDDRDRAALLAASQQLMQHAQMGLWVGSGLGSALAFRTRWLAAARALRTSGGAGAGKALFYPTAAAAPAGAAGAASQATKQGLNIRFIAKGLGMGLLGGFVGYVCAARDGEIGVDSCRTQIGVITGTLAGTSSVLPEQQI